MGHTRFPLICNNLGVFNRWINNIESEVEFRLKDGTWVNSKGRSKQEVLLNLWASDEVEIVILVDKWVEYRRAIADKINVEVKWDNIWQRLTDSNTGYHEMEVSTNMLFRDDVEYRVVES